VGGRILLFLSRKTCGLPWGGWTQKHPFVQLAGKIASRRSGTGSKINFSFDFFAPFNSFFFEAQNSLNLKQNQGVTTSGSPQGSRGRKDLCLKSILRHSADLLYRFYNI